MLNDEEFARNVAFRWNKLRQQQTPGKVWIQTNTRQASEQTQQNGAQPANRIHHRPPREGVAQGAIPHSCQWSVVAVVVDSTRFRVWSQYFIWPSSNCRCLGILVVNCVRARECHNKLTFTRAQYYPRGQCVLAACQIIILNWTILPSLSLGLCPTPWNLRSTQKTNCERIELDWVWMEAKSLGWWWWRIFWGNICACQVSCACSCY